MISNLHISRFKSIKEWALPCRRINIFIGEPNTGKSNILEALGLFSFLGYSSGYTARDFLRFERTSNLFYDESLERPLEIKCDAMALTIEFKDGRFQGVCHEGGGGLMARLVAGTRIAQLHGDHGDLNVSSVDTPGGIAPFKFYRFRVKEVFPRRGSEFLLPPSGDNLLSLLVANRELRSTVNAPFLSRGFRLGLRPQEGKIEVVKQIEDVIISYPYSLVSDTLQRLTFHVAAILSNKDSVLVFEEPEAHSFPAYIKQLAELIALDQNHNQYFISTHNDYFLLPLLDKAPKDEVAVNIVYYEDYETKTQQLTEKDLEERGEVDIFSKLDRYLTGR
jgi:hypothetical protein